MVPHLGLGAASGRAGHDDDDYWHQGGRQGGSREARKSMDSLGARGPESVGPMFSRCGREQQGT